MRYFILIGDGMADVSGLETPLAVARAEAMDALAGAGCLGLVRTVPRGCVPGSDTGMLTILGYDPRTCLTSRSALEAAGCSIPLGAGQAVCRCNFVTVSEGYLRSYSGGELSRADTQRLLRVLLDDGPFSSLAEALGLRFYLAAPFRLLCTGPQALLGGLVTNPPHEILNRPVAPYLPTGPGSEALRAMMEEARRVLAPRALWPWAPGGAMRLPSFAALHGIDGTLITATPLVRGMGILAGLQVLCPPGATGDRHTDYHAKAEAAISCFEEGQELVIVHVEAPDACSHSLDYRGKVAAIEAIDREILAPVVRWLSRGEARILVLADHVTSAATGRHGAAPVPWLIYDNRQVKRGGRPYTEEAAGLSGVCYEDGIGLISDFLHPL